MTLEQIAILVSFGLSLLSAYKSWFGLVIEVKVLKAQFESENRNILSKIDAGFEGLRREMHLMFGERHDPE